MKTFFKILLAPFLWVFHSCSPLGEPVNEALSDNHYYNSSKSKIIYSPMGNWFELGKTEMNVDIESFKVLNRNFGKDKDHVYYESYLVAHPDIDLASFHAKNEDYMTDLGFDHQNVYILESDYKEGKGYAKITLIKNADPSSYEQVDFDWGKDAVHHFYKHKVVNVDYESFKNLHNYFSLDKDNVYIHYRDYFAPINADAGTFSMLEKSDYAIDKNHLYHMSFTTNGKNDTKLLTIPYEEHENIDLLNSTYLKCGKAIYYRGIELAEADVESFQALSTVYAKDKEHVYYKQGIIPEADVETFEISEDSLGVHDKHGRYRNGSLHNERNL